jgi:hypothetical protein
VKDDQLSEITEVREIAPPHVKGCWSSNDQNKFNTSLRALIKTIRQLGKDFLPEDSDLFETISDAIQSGT